MRSRQQSGRCGSNPSTRTALPTESCAWASTPELACWRRWYSPSRTATDGHPRDAGSQEVPASGAVDRRLRVQAIAAFMLGKANETLDGCFTDHDSGMQL